jgi:hypothetical protein
VLRTPGSALRRALAQHRLNRRSGRCDRSDHIDVTLPPGYVVDELPDPVSLDTDFASYHSVVTADATSLHYSRKYTVKPLQLDASRYDDVRKFGERVAYDEATSAVLKKK